MVEKLANGKLKTLKLLGDGRYLAFQSLTDIVSGFLFQFLKCLEFTCQFLVILERLYLGFIKHYLRNDRFTLRI